MKVSGSTPDASIPIKRSHEPREPRTTALQSWLRALALRPVGKLRFSTGLRVSLDPFLLVCTHWASCGAG